MSRFMSAVWVVQFFVLLAAAMVAVARPSRVISLMEECAVFDAECQCCAGDAGGEAAAGGEPQTCSGGCYVPRGVWSEPPVEATGEACAPSCGTCAFVKDANQRSCAVMRPDLDAQALAALVRLLAPFLLAFALFSLHALMREDERVRRNLSFIFAFIYVVLAVLIYTDHFTDTGINSEAFQLRALQAALLTLALFALQGALRSPERVQRALWALVCAGYAGLDALATAGVLPLPTAAGAALGLFLFDSLVGDIEQMRARVFALVLLFPAVLTVMDAFAGSASSGSWRDESTFSQVLLVFLVFCVFVHALYAVWPQQAAVRRMSGTANTRPSALWALWLLQGLFFIGVAASLIWAHSRGHSVFLEPVKEHAYDPIFGDIDEVYPAFLVALGLFSFSGMHSSREWVWKAHCVIFAAFYLAQILCLLLAWNYYVFRAWVPAALTVPVALFAIHLRFYVSHREWFSEEVGEGPDGWVFVDLVLGPLLLARTLLSRRRATHARGVAAWGRLKVLPREEGLYPEHDFFQPGRQFDVQIRFANEQSDDDAAADARGAALRLSSSDRSPFDLVLSTGAYSGAEHVIDLAQIAALGALGRPGRRMLARSAQFFEGGIAALRRAPASYTLLRYHSQVVRFWVALDNQRYLVRYRLTPEDLSAPESGAEVTRDDFLGRERLPSERRPTDYLRRELKMRLEGKRVVVLRLQAQFHRATAGDGLQWYNPGADWPDDHEHRWVDLAKITLEDVLSDEQAERLAFNPDNAPSSLGTPVSAGLFDHRSIADSERRVMRRVQSVRQWMLQSFGPPSSAPRPVE